MPILVERTGLVRSPIPPAMSAKGRYLVPPFPEESQLATFRKHSEQRRPPGAASFLDVNPQSFSGAILHSLEATFGPPPDDVAVPRLVQNVVGSFHKYINQHPTWSHSVIETRKVAKMRANIQAAWDIVDVERQHRVSPVSALCVSGFPAPSKRHYRMVTQAVQTSRLEPTYTTGDTTATELWGAVGVDRFRQRHLAPPPP